VTDASTFTLMDNAVVGNPTILSYTDPSPASVMGTYVNHATGAGTKGVWDFVIGTPK
jgi:hypothetical protein